MATHIAGTVYDPSSAPLNGVLVRAHRRDTGVIIDYAYSGGVVSRWSSLINSTWAAETGRTILGASLIPAASHFRLTIASGSGSLTVDKMYIGEVAASGDVYDFATTPTAVTFGGLASATLAASATLTSDLIPLTTDGTKNIMVSYFVTGVTLALNTVSDWTSYYKNGDDAATVNATGYSPGQTAYLITRVDMIESTVTGAYDIACGTYTDEAQVVFLDLDDGTLYNDVIQRTYPVTV